MTTHLPDIHEVGIREHLRLWQEIKNREFNQATSQNLQDPKAGDPTGNTATESHDDDLVISPSLDDPASARDWGLVSTSGKDQEGDVDVHDFLRPGDVIGFR